MFWTNQDVEQQITVNVYRFDSNIRYDESEKITKIIYTSEHPDCGSDGCANFTNLYPGVYKYYASNGLYVWSTDEVTISENLCTTIRLYTSGSTLIVQGEDGFYKEIEGVARKENIEK